MPHPDSTRIALAAVLGLVAAGGNLLGGYFVVYRNWQRRNLQYFVALGAGYMLAVAFLDVIPESVRLAGDSAFLVILIGYFLIHLFEHTIAPHLHFGEETHHQAVSRHHVRSTMLLGLVIHTFFDGVAIASGFLVSNWLGVVIFVAIFLHKLPEGFTVASVVLASGQSRRTAMFAAIWLGFATVAGVFLMGILHSQVGYALPISAGVTLYVAATDLVPEVNREPDTRMALLVFLGVALMLLLGKLFHS